MFKAMGAKGSKGIGKQERSEIIEQIRTTIESGTTSNELASLANQFQRASSVNTEEILHSLSKSHKSFISAVKKNDLVSIIKIMTSRKVGINEQLQDKQNWKLTPLHVAALLGRAEIMRSLLSSLETDVNMLSKDGDTPLALGVKGAINEPACLDTVKILVEDRRCQVGLANSVGATPLSIAVAKGFKSVTHLLVSSNRIHIYSLIDLAMAIKLAVLYDRDELVDVIFSEMDRHSKNEFINLFGQNPELKSLSRLLSEWEQSKKRSAASSQEASELNEEDEEDEVDKMMATSKLGTAADPPETSSKIPNNFMVTISTTAETLASKSTKDNFGHTVRVGNLVQILNEDTVRRFNPRISQETDFIEAIANKNAYVHDIDAEGDMYVDILETVYSGHINANCVKFVDFGPRQLLSDGNEVVIGYYVKVLEDKNTVQQLAKGHGGWKADMNWLLGKTGKICKIDKDGDIFILFPTGRHCFNPKALVTSSANEIQAKDGNGNWMCKGSFVKVTSNEIEFKYLHQEICQEYDDKYKKLLGNLVRIYKLRLFNQYCEAVVYIGSICYYLNPKCVQVMHPKDGYDTDLGIGDSVIIKESADCSGRLQKQLSGQIGTVVNVEINGNEFVMIIQMDGSKYNGEVFYFNPKNLQRRKTGNSPEKSRIDADTGGKSSHSPLDDKYSSSSAKNASSSSPNNTSASATSTSDDYGYGSSSYHGIEEIPSSKGYKERKGSSASVLSTGSHYSDGLQIIARKDLEIKRKLGEGGFGCVTVGSWRGTDCAIKQVRTVVTSHMDYDDILKEARIQYGLKHPNVVQLYGISYENDLWMVMQLVNGMDLHSVLFKNDSNGNREKVAYSFKIKISVQTTNAITFLHEKGFLHNDIKPENILIEKKTGNVFICDFGITRYLGSSMDLRTYSQKYTDNFSGTLQYIAPECFQKDAIEKKYLRPTFKSDIWALAAVFIELFTERELFPNEKSLYECKYMNNYSNVKALLKTIADSSIRTLLKRGIDVSPDIRPTASEMNRVFFNIMRSK